MNGRKTLLTRQRPLQPPRAQLDALRRRLTRLMIGEERVLDRLLGCLLVSGAVLLEGRSGVGEDRVVRCVVEAIGARFASISMTPDLVPADLAATLGIIACRDKAAAGAEAAPAVLLVKRIDNAPRKIQSLLLEACDEKSVAFDGHAFRLPAIFLLIATQATADHPGAHPLSAEQRDRFLFHVTVDWLEEAAERAFMRMSRTPDKAPTSLRIARDVLQAARADVAAIPVDGAAEQGILSLIGATRSPQENCREVCRWIETGIGLCGTIGLDRAARTQAWLDGRATVTLTDVRAVAPDVLRHRIALTAAARAEQITPDDVVKTLLDRVLASARAS